MDSALSKVFEVIREGREAGLIHLHWGAFDSRLSPEDLNRGADSRANHFLLSVGLLPNAHREINRTNALKIIAYLLHRDLAYSEILLPEDSAQIRAERFLAECEKGERARYFTNGFPSPERCKVYDLEKRQLSGWNSVTESTFDAGVVLVTPSGCGIIWVEDED